MKPKQKAQSLFKIVESHLPCEGNTTGYTPIEILKEVIDEFLKDEYDMLPAKWMNDYWREVKSELDKI